MPRANISSNSGSEKYLGTAEFYLNDRRGDRTEYYDKRRSWFSMSDISLDSEQ